MYVNSYLFIVWEPVTKINGWKLGQSNVVHAQLLSGLKLMLFDTMIELEQKGKSIQISNEK